MIDVSIEIATARVGDLPEIITIMAEGQVPFPRDKWSDENAPHYRVAFEEMLADSRIDFIVARADNAVLGYAVVDFSRSLGSLGMRRATLQSLFIAAAMRGGKIGARLLAEAERRAQERGAARMDLISDKLRLDAHRFYRSNGYVQSHEGFKKSL
jgi:GNAT superfamily N-acetyltransferase